MNTEYVAIEQYARLLTLSGGLTGYPDTRPYTGPGQGVDGELLAADIRWLLAEHDHAEAQAEDWKRTYDREVRQFNAGHLAGSMWPADKPLPRDPRSDEPDSHERPDRMYEPDEDTWGNGFAWACYERMADERDAAEANAARLAQALANVTIELEDTP